MRYPSSFPSEATVNCSAKGLGVPAVCLGKVWKDSPVITNGGSTIVNFSTMFWFGTVVPAAGATSLSMNVTGAAVVPQA